MAMEVRCSVDNCHHWQDKKCSADNIEVNMQGSGEACSPDATYCKTFKANDC
jgi:hypothetical protein